MIERKVRFDGVASRVPTSFFTVGAHDTTNAIHYGVRKTCRHNSGHREANSDGGRLPLPVPVFLEEPYGAWSMACVVVVGLGLARWKRLKRKLSSAQRKSRLVQPSM